MGKWLKVAGVVAFGLAILSWRKWGFLSPWTTLALVVSAAAFYWLGRHEAKGRG